MAKLITKFKYLKPNARQSVGGYAKYIATREGVEKIDQSYRLSPSSQKQQQLIEEIIKAIAGLSESERAQLLGRISPSQASSSSASPRLRQLLDKQGRCPQCGGSR